MHLKNEMESFIGHISVRRPSNTVKAYKTDLEKFGEYCESNGINIIDATSLTIDSYLARLKDAGFKPRTLARKLSSLSMFYRYLIRQGTINASPVENVEGFKVSKRKPDFLNFDEIKALRLASGGDQMLTALVEFLLATGVRRSELCSLDRRMVDFEVKTVRVIGKGDIERAVMFSSLCSNALQEYINNRKDDNEALFVNLKGQRLNQNMVYYRIRKLGYMAIGRGISPHLFRHTCATYLMDGGMTLAEVQELLGHADISSTAIYTHPTPSLRQHYDDAIGRIER